MYKDRFVEDDLLINHQRNLSKELDVIIKDLDECEKELKKEFKK
jgi:hypothetical protein